MTSDHLNQRRPDEDHPPTQWSRAAAWIFYGAAAATLVIDQLSKLAVVRQMSEGQSEPVLGPYLSRTLQFNPGGAFGLFPSQTVGLTILGAVIVVVLVTYGRHAANSSGSLTVGLGLILGGAAGNLIDRIRLGYVIDFIDLHFWPVFNVADAAITCGAIILVVAIARCSRRE